jgi:hypothetical protein
MKKFLVVILASIVVSHIAVAQQSVHDTGNVVLIPLPAHISRDAVQHADTALKTQLHEHVRNWLAAQGLSTATTRNPDVIVILTDASGAPILPDLKAARENPPTPTTNELTFTFNSPDFPWTPSELSDLAMQLNAYYSAAREFYGSPAFNNSINVRKDPNLAFAGEYNPSFNEMYVQRLEDHDVICHEMIHAFHDDYLVGLNSYEEGMTRAAEVEVFDRITAYTHSFDQAHSYSYDVYYDALNQPEIGSRNGYFFQTSPNIYNLLRYQLAGYAWGKALLENPLFFATFNQQYYAAILSDPLTQTTEAKLLDLAAAAAPTIEGLPFRTWYAKQAVLNAAPPEGYFLYQRVNQFDVSYFHRDANGFETMQANAPINWAVYDYQNTLLDSGTGTTTAGGFYGITPNIPTGYVGRLKISTSTMSPNGPISNVAYRSGRDDPGISGVTLEANAGTVAITSLDSGASVTTSLNNGVFSVPSLASARGRFRATLMATNGQSFSKLFNKDASDYFVLLVPPTPLQVTSAVSRKTHGAAGTFDIELPLTGAPAVECRSSGGNHSIVVSFPNNIASGSASVVNGIGSLAGAPTFAGNTMTVNLAGVADVQQLTLSLSNVTDVFGQALPDTNLSMNVLIGDTTGNKTVSASDIGQTKNQSGSPVTISNFREDVTVSGAINTSDIGLVKSRSGSVLP